MSEQVTVTIPDGEYCKDCVFLNHYDYPLVDIMGNETGNRKAGYECKRHKMPLEPVQECCQTRIKKCSLCTMDENARKAMWLLGFMTLCKLTSDNNTMQPQDNKPIEGKYKREDWR